MLTPLPLRKMIAVTFLKIGGHSEWLLAFSVAEDVTHQAGMVEIMLVHVIMSEMLAICST